MVMYKTYFFNEVESTNTTARNLADEGAEHGTAIVASDQTAGRGRLGKSWHSASGKGLYCSFIVRPDLAAENYAKITLAAGLAVALVIEKFIGREVGLKWPNDILIDGKKCCGILTESSQFTASGFKYAIIGVGINMNQTETDWPESISGMSTSLFLSCGRTADTEELLEDVRQAVLGKVDLLEAGLFSDILSDWKNRDFFGWKVDELCFCGREDY